MTDMHVKAPEVGPNADALTSLTRGRGPRRGNLEALLKYWRPIMKRPGGFRRCVVTLMDKPQFGGKPQRICAWLHHELTGKWPNEGNHHGRGGRSGGGRRRRRGRRKKSFSVDTLVGNSLRETVRESRSLGGVMSQPIDGRQNVVEMKAAMFLQRYESHVFPEVVTDVKRVGIFGGSSRLAQGAQAVGTAIAPGDISDVRSPVRSQIYEMLTPGFGFNIPGRTPRRRGGRGARNKFRCPPGYENGGTFTNSEFSTCGAQILGIPKFGPGAPTLAAARELASLASTAGLVQEIGDLRNNSNPLDIIRAAQIPQAPKKGSPTRAQTSIDFVLQQYSELDFPIKAVRRDGVILEPVVPVQRLAQMNEFDDLADGNLIDKYSSGVIGAELVPAFSSGLRAVYVFIPGVGAVKINRVGGELSPEERAGLLRRFSEGISRAPDMPDPSEDLRAWADASNGRFTVEFGEVTSNGFNVSEPKNELLRVVAAGGIKKTVPRWVYETFMSRSAPRRAKNAPIFEIESEEKSLKVFAFDLPTQPFEAELLMRGAQAYNKNISTKVATFRSLSFKAPSARRIGRTIGETAGSVGGGVSAVFDSGANRFRCPPGTRHGGRFSDQFGRNCGGVAGPQALNRLQQLTNFFQEAQSTINRLNLSGGNGDLDRVTDIPELREALEDAKAQIAEFDTGDAGMLGPGLLQPTERTPLIGLRYVEILERMKADERRREIFENVDWNNLEEVRELFSTLATVEAGRLEVNPPQTPGERRRAALVDNNIDLFGATLQEAVGKNLGTIDAPARPRRARRVEDPDAVDPSPEVLERLRQGSELLPGLRDQLRRYDQFDNLRPGDEHPDRPGFFLTENGGFEDRFGRPMPLLGGGRSGSGRTNDRNAVDITPEVLERLREYADPDSELMQRFSEQRSRQEIIDNLRPGDEHPDFPGYYLDDNGGLRDRTGRPLPLRAGQADLPPRRPRVNPNSEAGFVEAARAEVPDGPDAAFERDKAEWKARKRYWMRTLAEIDDYDDRRWVQRLTDENLQRYADHLSAEDQRGDEINSFQEKMREFVRAEMEFRGLRRPDAIEPGDLPDEADEQFDVAEFQADLVQRLEEGGLDLGSFSQAELDDILKKLDRVLEDNSEPDDGVVWAGIRDALRDEQRRRDALRIGSGVGINERFDLNDPDGVIDALEELDERLDVAEDLTTRNLLERMSNEDLGFYLRAVDRAIEEFDDIDLARLRDDLSREVNRRNGEKPDTPDVVNKHFDELVNRWEALDAGDMGALLFAQLSDDDVVKFRNALARYDGNDPRAEMFRRELDKVFEERFGEGGSKQHSHLPGQELDEKFDLFVSKDIEAALREMNERMFAFDDSDRLGVTQEFWASLSDRDLMFYEQLILRAGSVFGEDNSELRLVLRDFFTDIREEVVRRGPNMGRRPAPRTDAPSEAAIRNVRNRFPRRGLPGRAYWRDEDYDRGDGPELDRRFGRYYDDGSGVLNERGRLVNRVIKEDRAEGDLRPVDDDAQFNRFADPELAIPAAVGNILWKLSQQLNDNPEVFAAAVLNAFQEAANMFRGGVTAREKLNLDALRSYVDSIGDPQAKRLATMRLRNFRALNAALDALDRGDNDRALRALAMLNPVARNNLQQLVDGAPSPEALRSPRRVSPDSLDRFTPDFIVDADAYDLSLAFEEVREAARNAPPGPQRVQALQLLREMRQELARRHRAARIMQTDEEYLDRVMDRALNTQINSFGDAGALPAEMNRLTILELRDALATERGRVADGTGSIERVQRLEAAIAAVTDVYNAQIGRDGRRYEQKLEDAWSAIWGSPEDGMVVPHAVDDASGVAEILRNDFGISLEDWPELRRDLARRIDGLSVDDYARLTGDDNLGPEYLLFNIDRVFEDARRSEIFEMNLPLADRSREALEERLAYLDNFEIDEIARLARRTEAPSPNRLQLDERLQNNRNREIGELELELRRRGAEQMGSNIEFPVNAENIGYGWMSPDDWNNLNAMPTRDLLNMQRRILADKEDTRAYADKLGEISEILDRRNRFGPTELQQPIHNRSDAALENLRNVLSSEFINRRGMNPGAVLSMQRLRDEVDAEIGRREARNQVGRAVGNNADLDGRLGQIARYDWKEAAETRRAKRRQKIKALAQRRYGDDTPWDITASELSLLGDREAESRVRAMYSDGVEMNVGEIEIDGVVYQKIIQPEINDVYIQRESDTGRISYINAEGVNNFILRAPDGTEFSERGSPSHLDGGIARTLNFKYNADGRLSANSHAYHSYLGFKKTIDGPNGQKVDFSGGGASNEFNDNAALWYGGLGIPKYKVSAAADGVAVWARHGYRNSDSRQIIRLNERMELMLERYNGYKLAKGDGREITAEMLQAKALIKDDIRAARIDTMLSVHRDPDSRADQLPAHHDFLVALDGPNGERNAVAFQAFKGRGFRSFAIGGPGQDGVPAEEIAALEADDPDILDKMQQLGYDDHGGLSGALFEAGTYDVQELFPRGWFDEPDPASRPETINQRLKTAERWSVNPNRVPLDANNDPAGALPSVAVGANGIDDQATAVQRLRDGGDIMEIPDFFVAQAIFDNSDHPGSGHWDRSDVVNATPRYEVITGIQRGINNAGADLTDLPSGMTFFRDSETGQLYGFKFANGYSFGHYGGAVEVTARMLQERMGMQAGQIRWDGPMGEDNNPNVPNPGTTRGLVIEMAHNWVPEGRGLGDTNTNLRLQDADGFGRNIRATSGNSSYFEGGIVTEPDGTEVAVGPVNLEDMFQMTLLDMLLGNPDRHEGNFGIYVDPETNEQRLVPWDNEAGLIGGARFGRGGQVEMGRVLRQQAMADGDPAEQMKLLQAGGYVSSIHTALEERIQSDREGAREALSAVMERMAFGEEIARLGDDIQDMVSDVGDDLSRDNQWELASQLLQQRYDWLLEQFESNNLDYILDLI